MNKACAKCGNEWSWTGLQYRGTTEDYDGTSEWICGGCGTHWGRWSGRELVDGEFDGTEPMCQRLFAVIENRPENVVTPPRE